MCLDSLTLVRQSISYCATKESQDLVNTLVASFAQELEKVVAKFKGTASRTFGPNDPLTASWMLSNLEIDSTSHQRLITRIREALNRLQTLGDHALVVEDNTADDHGWVALTLMRAVRTHGDSTDQHLLDQLRQWALDQARQQLSFQATGEPGFDPAHLSAVLAASLQGGRAPLPLLVAGANSLIESQRSDGSWSLQRPFVANSQGGVNLPIAPEMTIAIADFIDSLEVTFPQNRAVEEVQLRLLDALQRQRDWYYLTGNPTDRGALVWSSEYAKLSGTKFHIWATARVVAALARLRQIEARLVTSRLISDSGLTARRARSLSVTFQKLVDPERSLAGGTTATQWLKSPMGEADSGKKSALLYGPPGTSKTSLAEAVAKRLGWWLIEVSPADFLIDGPNSVESRAKRLFDYLVQLEGVVVLFDEIDRLVLDRTTKEYERQDNVFQFMTPSMLPKLAALWRAPRVKFLIATNYGESIDPAITRPDRIDQALLIPPPDLQARRDIVASFKKSGGGRMYKSQGDIDAIAHSTPLWTYGDLKGLSPEKWKEQVAATTPAVSLDEYAKRLTSRKEWRKIGRLADETLVIAQLLQECKAPIRGTGKRAVVQALKLASKEVRLKFPDLRKLVKESK